MGRNFMMDINVLEHYCDEDGIIQFQLEPGTELLKLLPRRIRSDLLSPDTEASVEFYAVLDCRNMDISLECALYNPDLENDFQIGLPDLFSDNIRRNIDSWCKNELEKSLDEIASAHLVHCGMERSSPVEYPKPVLDPNIYRAGADRAVLIVNDKDVELLENPLDKDEICNCFFWDTRINVNSGQGIDVLLDFLARRGDSVFLSSPSGTIEDVIPEIIFAAERNGVVIFPVDFSFCGNDFVFSLSDEESGKDCCGFAWAFRDNLVKNGFDDIAFQKRVMKLLDDYSGYCSNGYYGIYVVRARFDGKKLLEDPYGKIAGAKPDEVTYTLREARKTADMIVKKIVADEAKQKRLMGFSRFSL